MPTSCNVLGMKTTSSSSSLFNAIALDERVSGEIDHLTLVKMMILY